MKTSLGRHSSSRATIRSDQPEDQKTEDGQYKVEIKDVLSGLGSALDGKILSVSELIQMKLKQITSGTIDTMELDGSILASQDDLEVQSSEDLGGSNISSGGRLGYILVQYIIVQPLDSKAVARYRSFSRVGNMPHVIVNEYGTGTTFL